MLTIHFHILATATDVTSKEVHILCDYDALYTAIELKLSGLPHVQMYRFEPNLAEQPDNGRPETKPDLIIVAPVPPINDPISILARASLLSRIGEVPVLIISEQPSRPESDDRITYLNFPFDMDDLNKTVMDILEERHHPAPAYRG